MFEKGKFRSFHPVEPTFSCKSNRNRICPIRMQMRLRPMTFGFLKFFQSITYGAWASSSFAAWRSHRGSASSCVQGRWPGWRWSHRRHRVIVSRPLPLGRGKVCADRERRFCSREGHGADLMLIHAKRAVAKAIPPFRFGDQRVVAIGKLSFHAFAGVFFPAIFRFDGQREHQYTIFYGLKPCRAADPMG